MTLLPFLLLFFSSFPVVQGFLLPISKTSPRLLLAAAGNQDHHDDWSLSEDWALMDGIQTYTICSSASGNTTYTFWDRLVSSTPLLRGRRSAAETQQHYTLLLKNKKTPTQQPTAAGPPPPLLQDWWMKVEENSAVIGMGGRLDDGRYVWFSVASLGHFAGHVLDNYEAPPCLSAQAIPGGYCEAAGGTIYELGRPRASGSYSSAVSINSQKTSMVSGVQISQMLAAVSLVVLGIVLGMTYGISMAVSAQAPTSIYEHGPAGAIVVRSSPEQIKAQQKLRVMEEQWMQERMVINNIDQSQFDREFQQLENNERLQKSPQVGWSLW